MKKLLSLILALSLLLSLASCGGRGNESSNEAPNESSNIDNVSDNSSEVTDAQYLVGMNSMQPISKDNKPAKYKEIKEYTPPTYLEDYDPNRQTLTKAEYERLYNAIIKNNIEFPGTENSYTDVVHHIDLRQYSKSLAMNDYMVSKFGNKTFTEQEVINHLSEKFVVTEYDLYCLRIRRGTDWQPSTNTYAFYAEYPSGKYAVNSGTSFYLIYDSYMGYRDMGENKYEFYFRLTDPEKLISGMFNKWNESSLTDDEKQQLAAVKATANNGVLTYNGKKYYAIDNSSNQQPGDPIMQSYWCFNEQDCYKVITLELKDENIKLVDIREAWKIFDESYSLPTTFSKIPVE